MLIALLVLIDIDNEDYENKAPVYEGHTTTAQIQMISITHKTCTIWASETTAREREVSGNKWSAY